MTLLAVPNLSEGRDAETLAAIRNAFGGGVLDVHTDPDHHRTVFTIAGEAGELAAAVLRGADVALQRIDLTSHQGVHPRVGALDVAPIVHLTDQDRGAAVAEALVLADELGRRGVPVYLYNELGGGRTRAQLRRDIGAFTPDFGPDALHATAGATLVTARPPLVAFNVIVDAPLDAARAIAARIREGGSEGLAAVRALGVPVAGGAQVTTNIEDHRATTPAQVVAAVARHAPVLRAELVALAPEAAFRDWPGDVEIGAIRTIEAALRK